MKLIFAPMIAPMIAIGLALGLQFAPQTANALNIQPGEFTLTEATDANDKPIDYLQLDGAIAWPMADKLEEILKNLKPNRLLLIKFNSPGGSDEQGRLIIDLLKKDIAQGRRIQTTVLNGDMCASMCVPIYMQGQRRYAGEGSLFMFHGAIQPEFSNVPDQFTTSRVLQIFIDAGIDQKWLEDRKAEGVFSDPGAYWISGRELFDAHSNVITKVLPRFARETPWHADVSPEIHAR